MKAIVQKAKNILFGDTKIDRGVVVFVLDGSQIEWIIKKAEKLKMWNEWKKSAVDMKFIICIWLPEKDRGFSELSKIENIVFLESKKLEYVNDGPCTFLLD